MPTKYHVDPGKALFVQGPAVITVVSDIDPVIGVPPDPPEEADPPAISVLTPSTALATDVTVALTVSGTGFTASSVINFNGADVTTVFGSDTQLTADITPPGTAGDVPVVVKNGADVSNSVTFAFTDPARTAPGRKR